MNVEIWSDYACPFCYIGKRRLETALQQFAHKDQINVVFRSFELDPNAPKDTDQDVNAMLAAKYGMSIEQAKANNRQLTQSAAGEGLEYHLDELILTNTFDAHRLMYYGMANGKGKETVEALFKAYFTDSKHLGDHSTLVAIAQEAGLDPEAVAAVLASDEYTQEVRADEREARNIGVQGVPFFVIDRKYAVSGAQPAHMFLEVLEKAWHEANPITVMNTASGDGGVCTDGACMIDDKK
ncbi:DsbA family oxidoreductase [Paenibacillus marinisediminis]